MRHVVLLGDSVFDNGAYTDGGPDVAAHLRELLPPPSAVALCAVDGARINDVDRQLGCVPTAATHIVLSVGGNDLLGIISMLSEPVGSMFEALDLLQGHVAEFAAAYERFLDRVLALGRPVTVCTVYNGNFGPEEGPRLAVALAPFDDVILRAALRRGLPAIELREVCNEPGDFYNPIEPSDRAGRKIAQAIVGSFDSQDTGPGRTIVTGG